MRTSPVSMRVHSRTATRSRDKRFCWLALAVVVLGVTGETALADWLPAEQVTSADGSRPRISFDVAGNAFAIWEESSTDRLAIRTTHGPFGAPQIGPGPAAWEEVRVAFDAAGNAIVAWFGVSGWLTAARRGPGPDGTYGTVQTVSNQTTPSSTLAHLDLAVNPSGEALLAWVEPGGNGQILQVAYRPAGPASTFGTPQTLANVSVSLIQPKVVLDPDGAAVVVWGEGSGLKQATQLAGGPYPAFAAATNLASQVIFPDGVSKALLPSGSAVLAWGEGTNGVDSNVIKVSSRTPGGSFPLGTPVSAGSFATQPRAAIGARGHELVSWITSSGGPCTPGQPWIDGSFREPEGEFSDATRLTSPNHIVATHGHATAVAADGSIMVIYKSRGADGIDPCGAGSYKIAARVEAFGLPGSSQVISATAGAGNPDAAFDAFGNGFGIWEAGSIVEGARFEAPTVFGDGFESGGLAMWSAHQP